MSVTEPVTLGDTVPEKEIVGDSEPLAVTLGDSEPDTLADAPTVPVTVPATLDETVPEKESVGDSEPLAVTLGDSEPDTLADAVALADAEREAATVGEAVGGGLLVGVLVGDEEKLCVGELENCSSGNGAGGGTPTTAVTGAVSTPVTAASA